MRKVGLVLLVPFLLALLGCEPVVSLNPLVRAEDGLVLPGLEGCWTETLEKSECIVEFQGTEDRSYRIVLAEEHGTTEFHGRLARLEEELYLDITPVRFDEGSSEGVSRILNLREPESIGKMHLLAEHTFYRLRIDGDILSLDYFTREWAVKQAEAEPSRLTIPGSPRGRERKILC